MVPKRHIPSLIDLGDGGEELLMKVMAVVRRVAAQIKEEHGAASVTICAPQQEVAYCPYFLVRGHLAAEAVERIGSVFIGESRVTGPLRPGAPCRERRRVCAGNSRVGRLSR
ncbi:hypothetical protein ACWGDX_07795 [Streptomyces sp. NPDC055025]